MSAARWVAESGVLGLQGKPASARPASRPAHTPTSLGPLEKYAACNKLVRM